MGEQSTPLASAFFRMVIFGGAVGVVTSLGLHIIGFFNSGLPHPMTVLGNAGMAFLTGLPAAASAAAPALGMHRLVEARKPALRIPVAALGAVLGPLAAISLLTGVPPFEAPVPTLGWALFLPAAAVAAVHFTKPLRQSRVLQASAGGAPLLR
ncbi:hypothetical protein E2F48_03440 [Arthrobacter crusticola]|uniref:Uncharacterized protein n=1 Tax=Arthrobacter crusticola TaxID=2547960 RepID=A0A4R5U390_9MICC|nr:hypothetical protein [Arthrobacter crusticola]TDK28159.1 hypothetical protein E2F48_03440 [Arthrobacter crusticola]